MSHSPIHEPMSSQQRRSYRQYVSDMRKAYPKSPVFEAIDKFFNKPPSGFTWTRVSVTDCVGGIHKTWAPKWDSKATAEVLSTSSPDISTRIIIIETRPGKTMDQAIIDLLGSCYDIDPVFLYTHLTQLVSEAPPPRHRAGNASVWIQQAYGEGYQFNGMVCCKSENAWIDNVCPSVGLHVSICPCRVVLSCLIS